MTPRLRVLTFDLEEWFHLLEYEAAESRSSWRLYETRVDWLTDYILETLAEFDRRATFFILGWIAKEHSGLVRRIADAGHSLGSHSYGHELIRDQTRSTFERDLDRSIKCIEDAGQKPVIAYRAPGFSLTLGYEWVFDCLIEKNIRMDASLFLGKHAHGGYPGLGLDYPFEIERGGSSIKEFPVIPQALGGYRLPYSGGGYFRLIPYWAIRKLSKRQEYIMSYFHPRDFDTGQPVLTGLSPLRKFRAYVGIGRAFSKFRSWLRDEPFVDLAQASYQIDWDLLPSQKL